MKKRTNVVGCPGQDTPVQSKLRSTFTTSFNASNLIVPAFCKFSIPKRIITPILSACEESFGSRFVLSHWHSEKEQKAPQRSMSKANESTVTRGAFVVLEGLDRSGKSTQVALLEKKLRAEGREVRVMRFPGRFPRAFSHLSVLACWDEGRGGAAE